jgi:hypothetical protein
VPDLEVAGLARQLREGLILASFGPELLLAADTA